jgi:Pentapeptide repeats (8 copies)
MANDEHVAILEKGVAAWNAWRDENADIPQPDLSRADLTEANLRETSLQASTPLDTNFTAADLTGCRVYGISAWGLKLERASSRTWSSHLLTSPRSPSTTSSRAVHLPDA